MTYRLVEKNSRLNITNVDQFKRLVCGTCVYNEICSEWELYTGRTLYSNITQDQTKKPLVSLNGKIKGVWRCASYAPFVRERIDYVI